MLVANTALSNHLSDPCLATGLCLCKGAAGYGYVMYAMYAGCGSAAAGVNCFDSLLSF